MGSFFCQRCDRYGESHDGDCVEDPQESCYMVHESCLSDGELAKEEAKRLVGEFLSTIDPILKEHRRER